MTENIGEFWQIEVWVENDQGEPYLFERLPNQYRPEALASARQWLFGEVSPALGGKLIKVTIEKQKRNEHHDQA